MSTAKATGYRSHAASLKLVASNYAFRCDAKFANAEHKKIEDKIRAAGYFELNEFLPFPFAKGVQPTYLDQPSDDSVPAVNTLSIQNLALNVANCRHIARDDFDNLTEERKLSKGDVLLTVDGGVSIGKPLLFSEDSDFTVDSHVVVLRPKTISPLSLVYLLASPWGQAQFARAESGASGQTTVTEDDVRRFIFPRAILSTISKLAEGIEKERAKIAAERAKLSQSEAQLWQRLDVVGI